MVFSVILAVYMSMLCGTWKLIVMLPRERKWVLAVAFMLVVTCVSSSLTLTRNPVLCRQRYGPGLVISSAMTKMGVAVSIVTVVVMVLRRPVAESGFIGIVDDCVMAIPVQ